MCAGLSARGDLADQEVIPTLWGLGGERKGIHTFVWIESDGAAAMVWPPGQMFSLSVPAGWRQDLPSGQADRFLRFVSEELIPWVETESRVDPEDRCYMGDSLGGLFGFYTLLTRPKAFSRYLIGSPGIHQEDPEVFRCEREYVSDHSDLQAQVYMCVGSLEEEARIANMRRLCQILEGRGYDGLQLTLRVFESQTHQSVIPYFLTGLTEVYN